MSFSTQTPDFIATLSFKPFNDNVMWLPKTNQKYRPQIKFPFSNKSTTGEQNFLNKEIVYPGYLVESEIMLLSPEFFANMLTEGMHFDVMENEKIIATGEITKIMNEELRKARR